MSLHSRMRYMNPYDIHKAIINEYILKRAGDSKLLQRDTSRDKTDHDVLKEHHKFLWDGDKAPETWEEQFAKKYYDKLFKEYCIGDLSLYKENKIALRWRIEKEVVVGKGQFICANKHCDDREGLKSWEVNFVYRERGEKKNALVKIRLCESCSKKLNYRTKKKEVKRQRNKKQIKRSEKDDKMLECVQTSATPSTSKDDANHDEDVQSLWASLKPIETKSREEEMEDYLHELLL